ncbi:hypothetical protein Hanom_Chr16g01474951 [Helianthus anomalus]
MVETQNHRRDDWTAFSERMENHTLFFLLNLDLQWRREKHGDVEMTCKRRIFYFKQQKCGGSMSCALITR